MKDNTTPIDLFLLALAAILGWLLILASGCKVFEYTPEKAERQSIKAYAHHPLVTTKLHKIWFPQFSQYIVGDTVEVIIRDTIKGEEIICPDGSTIQCPPNIIEYRYHLRIDTVVRIDEAALQHEKLKVEYLAAELAKSRTNEFVLIKDKADNKKWAVWATVIGALSVLAWLVFGVMKIVK